MNSSTKPLEDAVDDDAASLRLRYQALKSSESLKNELMEEILTKYAGAAQALKQVKEAFANEMNMVETLQNLDHLARTRGEQIQHLQNLLNHSPFIMVLIDGNQILFRKRFYARGEAGGHEVAAKLHARILQYATANVIECPVGVRVACRVYANLRGVTNYYRRFGLVEPTAQAQAFWRGFTSGKPLFDFVDVGSGDGAAAKITDQFKLHIFDYQCRQLFVACNTQQESAYKNLIAKYENDDSITGRVTLLQGAPEVSDSQVTKLPTAQFPELLRPAEIEAGLTQTLHSGLISAENSNTDDDSANALSKSRLDRAVTISNLSESFDVGARQDSVMSSVSPSNTPVTWASTAAKNAHAPLSDMTRKVMGGSMTVNNIRSASIQRNRKGQRIDEPQHYDRGEVQRVKQFKACNQYYIGIGCCHFTAGRADKCPHRHDWTFTAKELQTLCVIAKETPCKRGHGCEDLRCIYGHQCPYPVVPGTTGCLNGETCRFPKSMHSMDLQPVRTTKVK